MEGKTVILSVVLVSLVLGQYQAEAKICCPSSSARTVYNTCYFASGSESICVTLSGCQKVGSSCASGYDYVTLGHSGDHSVNAYCKLGCTSSVCDDIATLQTSGEAVNEAVEKCTKACSEFCTKGSKNAIENA